MYTLPNDERYEGGLQRRASGKKENAVKLRFSLFTPHLIPSRL